MTTRHYDAKLQPDGGLIIPTGAALGKVLSSDASGNAAWGPAASGVVALAPTYGAEITGVATEKVVCSGKLLANVAAANTVLRVLATMSGTQTAAAVTYIAKLRIGPTTLTGAIAATGGGVSPATARTTESFLVSALVRITEPGKTAKAIGGVEIYGNFFALSTLFATAATTAAVAFDSTIENLVELTLTPAATFTAGVIKAACIEVVL
jgi:hypothetical protein